MDDIRQGDGDDSGTVLLSTYYLQGRPELLVYVPEEARRVLDCGCGAGGLGALLKQRGVAYVAGIELDATAAAVAANVLDKVVQGDVEAMELPFEEGSFDCICFADVLEHLRNPAETVRRMVPLLAPAGVMVMSIPNVRFYGVIEMLATGRWKYEDAGILDKTHLRFFTAIEMVRLVQEAGLKVLRMAPLSIEMPENLPRDADGSVQMGRVKFGPVDDREYQDLLTVQYVLQVTRAEETRQG